MTGLKVSLRTMNTSRRETAEELTSKLLDVRPCHPLKEVTAASVPAPKEEPVVAEATTVHHEEVVVDMEVEVEKEDREEAMTVLHEVEIEMVEVEATKVVEEMTEVETETEEVVEAAAVAAGVVEALLAGTRTAATITSKSQSSTATWSQPTTKTTEAHLLDTVRTLRAKVILQTTASQAIMILTPMLFNKLQKFLILRTDLSST